MAKLFYTLEEVCEKLGRSEDDVKDFIAPRIASWWMPDQVIFIDAASGTFGVRLELPNPEQAIPGGLHCQVRFLAE